jgi:hypothetical protein
VVAAAVVGLELFALGVIRSPPHFDLCVVTVRADPGKHAQIDVG